MMSDPSRIDIIVNGDETCKLMLVMTEHRKWDEDPNMAKQFFEKARTYLGWVQSEGFRKEHPGIETKNVVIELACKHEPSEEVITLMGRMNEATEGKSGVRFRYRTA